MVMVSHIPIHLFLIVVEVGDHIYFENHSTCLFHLVMNIYYSTLILFFVTPKGSQAKESQEKQIKGKLRQAK